MSLLFEGVPLVLTLPKAITFDCYGTLIDWESAIQQFFAESLDSKGFGNVDPLTLQAEWEEIQFLYIQEQYRPYRQVLRDTLRMAFDNYHILKNDVVCDKFANSMGYWELFLDTRDAMLDLQK